MSTAVERDAIVLDPRDNVATALRALDAGEIIVIASPSTPITLTVREPIPLCHKLAIRDLQAGDEIFKYGESIGRASLAIRAGTLVHVHNLRSGRGQRCAATPATPP